MGKSSRKISTSKPLEQKLLTKEQLLIGFILTLLIGVLVTIIVMLSLQKKPAQATIDRTLFPESLAVEALYVSIDPSTATIKVDKYGRPKPVLTGSNLRTYDKSYKSETIDILLEIDQRLEYKAIMDSGEVLLYDWQSDGDVHFDLHANQVGDDSGFWTLYSEGDGRQEHGSIVALYLGEHGWYWKNLEDRPVNIKIVVAGYYDKFIKMDINTKEH